MKKTSAVIIAVIMLIVCSVSVCAQDLPYVPIGTKVKIVGMSLVLDGEIGFVYHIEVPEKYLSAYALLTCNGNDETKRVNIADCPQDAQGRYTVKYNLSAIQLSEKVIIMVLDQSGTQLAFKAKSAEDYVTAMIADANSTAKEIAVAKALINYGHYAQIACAEYGEWKIGVNYTETSAYNAPTVTQEVFDSYKVLREGTIDCDVAFQLQLDYKTDFVIYLLDCRQDPTVTVNGETAYEFENCGNGIYRLFIQGINVMYLDSIYEININGTLTLTASPFSYGYLAMSGSNESTRLALLSMYEFYQATRSYNG